MRWLILFLLLIPMVNAELVYYEEEIILFLTPIKAPRLFALVILNHGTTIPNFKFRYCYGRYC